jgi:hypothetical protein
MGHHSSCGIVLAVIQEKVNNPSPDDPFEPDIAAVRVMCTFSACLILISAFQQLKNDKAKFLATAKEWSKK